MPIPFITQLIILLLMISNLSSCSTEDRVQNQTYDLMLQALLSHSVPTITVDSLHAIKHKAVLLDTRSREEYDVSRIEHSHFAGYKNFDATVVEDLPKDTSIVLYCAVGYRSGKIGEKLQQKGFTNVVNLYGGIFEWKNQNHPVVTDSGKTDKIHAYNKAWGYWLQKGEKVYSSK